ncbi:hypothetical protein KQ51_01743 [Candidatus Izimaplasma bacterium HR1]|jgi:hydrogenase maturation factor HypF (carbamoyltransferase family)|uniref:hypothetical protein n=1 Tax=Candidatus Izimoplasma sp. HR1 TaxID=1541959 RepID=UPI0004F761D2|nr:hypothetical protein KQ51_01743 [Candidatus Izimaplasma bacterium HR1]
MSFNSWIGTIAETKELHSVISLRSRYYKTNYQQAKAVVLEHAEAIKVDVRNIDDEHKEILLQNSRFHIIVSFVQVNPIETSIDFKVEMYGFFGMHRPRKMITKFYEYLDNNLKFKGVGLHP